MTVQQKWDEVYRLPKAFNSWPQLMPLFKALIFLISSGTNIWTPFSPRSLTGPQHISLVCTSTSHLGCSVLDLIDLWFQPSILKDGKGVTRQVQSHGQKEYSNAKNMWWLSCNLLPHVDVFPRPDSQHVVTEGNLTDRPVESKPDLLVSGRATYRFRV